MAFEIEVTRKVHNLNRSKFNRGNLELQEFKYCKLTKLKYFCLPQKDNIIIPSLKIKISQTFLPVPLPQSIYNY